MREQDLLAMEVETLARRSDELTAELGEMPVKLEQAYQEVFNLRFRLATRQLEDTSQLRKARRQIARLRTRDSEMRQELALIDMIRRERLA